MDMHDILMCRLQGDDVGRIKTGARVRSVFGRRVGRSQMPGLDGDGENDGTDKKVIFLQTESPYIAVCKT